MEQKIEMMKYATMIHYHETHLHQSQEGQDSTLAQLEETKAKLEGAKAKLLEIEASLCNEWDTHEIVVE